MGVRLIDLEEGDRVVGVAKLAERDEEAVDEPAPDGAGGDGDAAPAEPGENG